MTWSTAARKNIWADHTTLKHPSLSHLDPRPHAFDCDVDRTTEREQMSICKICQSTAQWPWHPGTYLLFHEEERPCIQTSQYRKNMANRQVAQQEWSTGGQQQKSPQADSGVHRWTRRRMWQTHILHLGENMPTRTWVSAWDRGEWSWNEVANCKRRHVLFGWPSDPNKHESPEACHSEKLFERLSAYKPHNSQPLRYVPASAWI
jgi:hypothetical protein